MIELFRSWLKTCHSRGALNSTLVIVSGEFGRTPKVNGEAGRDHHNKAWSVEFAGGGLQGDRVMGAMDKTATEITENPVDPEDLLCTATRWWGSPGA